MLDRALQRIRRTISFEKRRCYRAVFDLDGPTGHEVRRVLADLRRACHADRTTFDPDPQLAAYRQGKRDVWLLVQYWLNLSETEVQRLTRVEDDYAELEG